MARFDAKGGAMGGASLASAPPPNPGATRGRVRERGRGRGTLLLSAGVLAGLGCVPAGTGAVERGAQGASGPAPDAGCADFWAE